MWGYSNRKLLQALFLSCNNHNVFIISVISLFFFSFFLTQENYFGINQEFKELGIKYNREESVSDTTLCSDSKDTINLLTLRPMEANIILTLSDVKAELTKVRPVVTRYKVHLWNFI